MLQSTGNKNAKHNIDRRINGDERTLSKSDDLLKPLNMCRYDKWSWHIILQNFLAMPFNINVQYPAHGWHP